jgi:hypothetical protein
VSSPYTAPTLRGIILRDEDDKVIVQATPADIRAFGQQPGQSVNMRPETARVSMRRTSRLAGSGFAEQHRYGYGSGYPWPTSRFANSWSTGDDLAALNYASTEQVGARRLEPGRIDPEDYLYDRHGRPVATILSVNINVGTADVSTFGGGRQVMQTGLTDVDITAKGLPGVTV